VYFSIAKKKTHAHMATEHAQVITAYTHVAAFRRYDRFPNLKSGQ